MIPLYDEDETLKDELYTPEVRIDRVEKGIDRVEQWQWEEKRLTGIALTGETEGSVAFQYSDDRVEKVTTCTGEGERVLYYTYADGKVKRYTVTVDGNQEGSVAINRNGEGRIGGADIYFSGRYVLGLVDRFRNGEGTLVAARPAYRPAMEQMASTLEGMNFSEEETDPKGEENFRLVFNWYEGNVASEVMSGAVRLEIDPEGIVEDLTLLPESIRQMVYVYLLSHNELPVKLTFSNIVTYTYDQMENPYHGYLGDGLAAQNLSKNNILTARANVNIRVDLILFGREITLINRQVEQDVERDYLYNARNYPVQIAGDGLTVITYRD